MKKEERNTPQEFFFQWKNETAQPENFFFKGRTKRRSRRIYFSMEERNGEAGEFFSYLCRRNLFSFSFRLSGAVVATSAKSSKSVEHLARSLRLNSCVSRRRCLRAASPCQMRQQRANPRRLLFWHALQPQPPSGRHLLHSWYELFRGNSC